MANFIRSEKSDCEKLNRKSGVTEPTLQTASYIRTQPKASFEVDVFCMSTFKKSKWEISQWSRNKNNEKKKWHGSLSRRPDH